MSNLSKPDEVVFTNLDDEVVLLNLASRYYYTLNQSGQFIWRMLDQQKTEDEIVTAMTEEFEVDASTARDHLRELVTELTRERLLKADPT